MVKQRMTDDFAQVLPQLSPDEERFLKRYLVQQRLEHELRLMKTKGFWGLLHKMFRGGVSDGDATIPLVHYFFNRFVKSFPFLSLNTDAEQAEFWQEMQSFFEKMVGFQVKRSEAVSPGQLRRSDYINKKLLTALLTFFNAMIITDDEPQPPSPASSHKSTSPKLLKPHLGNSDMFAFENFKFYNDYHIDIVSVRRFEEQKRSVFGFGGSKTKLRYSYVLKVVHRTGEPGKFTYSCHFIDHTYTNFRVTLHRLCAELPGLVSAERFPLGGTKVSDDGFADFLAAPTENGTSSEESEDSTSVVKLYREKTRRTLRHWITTLLRYKEIVNSEAFQDFISDPRSNFPSLTPTDLCDYHNRAAHENHLVETQVVFQAQYLKSVEGLQAAFGTWKSEMIEEPQMLVEYGSACLSTHDVSKCVDPRMIAMYEWCVASMSSGIYDLFMASDYGYEALSRCMRLNSVMPHSLIYNVLKYSNPAKMISRGLDLMFMPLPSFGFLSGAKSKNTDNGKTNKNLVMMMLGTLTGQNTRTTDRNLKRLRQEETPENFDIFIERLENYFTLPMEVVVKIRDQAIANRTNLIYTVLSTDILKPKIAGEHDRCRLNDLKESLDAFEDIEHSDPEDYALWVVIRQYWDIFARKRDDRFMLDMWQNPLFSRAIQKCTQVYYKPFLGLMGRSGLHIAYNDFKNFLTELMSELKAMNDGEKYYMDSQAIYHRVNNVMRNWQQRAFDLMARAASNDKQKLLLSFPVWMVRFINDLRLKHTDRPSVTLNLSKTSADIDEELFLKQLRSKMAIHAERTYVFSQYRKKKSVQSYVTKDEMVKYNWRIIKHDVFGSDSVLPQLGIADADLRDMQNMFVEATLATRAENGPLERELLSKLHSIQADNDVGASELEKLDESVQHQLTTMMRKLKPTSEIKLA
ncbi:hypothetical protein DICA0_F30504 [Diutina catenulata]